MLTIDPVQTSKPRQDLNPAEQSDCLMSDSQRIIGDIIENYGGLVQNTADEEIIGETEKNEANDILEDVINFLEPDMSESVSSIAQSQRRSSIDGPNDLMQSIDQYFPDQE